MKEFEKVIAVQQMQDYIDDNLNKNITLYELAKCSNYSPWYCAKLFKEYIGKTPFEYIRLKRLSKAAIELRDQDKKVVDVALDFVFDSHEGFTRAFKKQFGLTPKSYKKDTPPISLFTSYPIKEQYIYENNLNTDSKLIYNNFFTQVINFPRRKCILKRGKKAGNYFEYFEETGEEVWGILSSIKEAINEPVGMWLPDKFIKENTSNYVQGVDVPLDYKGIVPEGFEIITLPTCKMMIFQGEPFENDNFQSAIVFLSREIDKYNPTLYGYEWHLNESPSFQMEPQGYRGYIKARPIKEIDTIQL
ncbi:AraC family transcriptional regulator [Terrisporobacter petrolearius]|uniref:helix-turn-helix transcriptional regulator n=1 Tax=Terrisporobacter petrolearius TaxID=1460447 RepID=UPI001D164C9C|nr:AraC family transcriptional regulator [Terrisporobacter petrolearius]MCC3865157.1 AraC family transcriptional regulator [Terrisporobacter petrolearius]